MGSFKHASSKIRTKDTFLASSWHECNMNYFSSGGKFYFLYFIFWVGWGGGFNKKLHVTVLHVL